MSVVLIRNGVHVGEFPSSEAAHIEMGKRYLLDKDQALFAVAPAEIVTGQVGGAVSLPDQAASFLLEGHFERGLVDLIARLKTENELDADEAFSNDDCVEVLNNLIAEARRITRFDPGYTTKCDHCGSLSTQPHDARCATLTVAPPPVDVTYRGQYEMDPVRDADLAEAKRIAAIALEGINDRCACGAYSGEQHRPACPCGSHIFNSHKDEAAREFGI